VIETILNHFNFFVAHSIELSALWDILPNQAIGILIGSTLPTGIRPGKVRSTAQSRINRLMHRKLTPVVTGDVLTMCLKGINSSIMAALTTSAVLLGSSLSSVKPDLRSTKVTITPLCPLPMMVSTSQ
jgi:hypothetical protein